MRPGVKAENLDVKDKLRYKADLKISIASETECFGEK